VILGLLAVIAVPQVAKLLGGAERKTAAIQIDQLSGILDIYRLEVGRYPSTEDGLNALVERPAGVERWNGPYLRKAQSLIDPWGNPYVYRYPGEYGEIDLYSLGSDGREGGEGNDADITSW
jgi:general secretion pathway protein G